MPLRSPIAVPKTCPQPVARPGGRERRATLERYGFRLTRDRVDPVTMKRNVSLGSRGSASTEPRVLQVPVRGSVTLAMGYLLSGRCGGGLGEAPPPPSDLRRGERAMP